MSTVLRPRQIWASLALALCFIPTAGHAGAYPDRAIRMIVPFTPGGIADLAARKLGARMSEELGQPIVIDNRPGANSNIGTEAAARATPDGYTILLAAVATMAINVHLYGTGYYDPVKDFQPISLLAKSPLVLTVGTSSPFNSVGDVIAAAKASPGTLNFGSAGIGSASHLALQMFKSAGHLDIVHVPYRGTSPIIPDLLTGRIDGYFDAPVSALSYLKASSTKALGVTSREPIAMMPGTPTVAATIPDFEFTTWIGVLAPSGLAPDKTERLNQAIRRSLADRAVGKWFSDQSLNPEPGTPDEFAAFIAAEIDKFGKLIRESGLKIQ